MSEAVKLRQAFEKMKNVQISYNAIFIKAVATALREYPILNSTLEENQIIILKNVNVGVAVSTERGLIVPVIHDADEKSLADLTSTIAELVERARLDKLSMGDVTGGTFAHVAFMEGIVVAENIMQKEVTIDHRVIPRCIYITPEIASVGLTEEKPEGRGIP